MPNYMSLIFPIVLILLLFWSISLNALFYFRLKQKSLKKETLELQEFLIDLMSGAGLIAVAQSGKVSRVDPDNVFLRSPRERR